jgi:hypothetical protein
VPEHCVATPINKSPEATRDDTHYAIRSTPPKTRTLMHLPSFFENRSGHRLQRILRAAGRPAAGRALCTAGRQALIALCTALRASNLRRLPFDFLRSTSLAGDAMMHAKLRWMHMHVSPKNKVNSCMRYNLESYTTSRFRVLVRTGSERRLREGNRF